MHYYIHTCCQLQLRCKAVPTRCIHARERRACMQVPTPHFATRYGCMQHLCSFPSRTRTQDLPLSPKLTQGFLQQISPCRGGWGFPSTALVQCTATSLRLASICTIETIYTLCKLRAPSVITVAHSRGNIRRQYKPATNVTTQTSL